MSGHIFKILWVILSPFILSVQKSDAQKNVFAKILPHYGRIQYAGGIGFMSVGLGYQSRNQRMEGEIYYGYVPESVGGITIHSATIQGNWVAVKPIRKGVFQMKPLVTGLLVNHSFGKQYFGWNPRQYPFSYYDYSTALHAAFLVGSELGFSFKNDGKNAGKPALYYQLVFFDSEIISFLNNRQLTLGDVVTLGLGIRVNF